MRVLAAMSGGVDSSVTAAVLHEAGHDVIGATLQLYDHGAASARKGACCAGQDIHDARRVADRIGIPHYVIDAEARFRSAVIKDFADSYAAGLTPVPCVRCNQTVKFTDLMQLAGDLGCDAMATGHYVRRVDGPDGPELHRAADPQRDQSWFLFATTRAQLARSLFPLGDMPDKAAVRAEAARLGLEVAAKPDSQDICFVPSGRYDAAVAKLRPDAMAPGEIVTADGVVVGQHDGVGRFTVGQANAASRRVVVGSRTSGSHIVRLREVNWLVDPPEALRCEVKLRARDSMHGAEVTADGLVTLDEPALAAPGQACVFYAGDRVMGGGFIASA
jgi:tRNA-specific 2-thiouridylase